MLAMLFLGGLMLGGVTFLGYIVSSSGGSSSTARFEGYLEQIADEQRERPSRELDPSSRETRTSEAALRDTGLKSRLQGALQSLDQSEIEGHSSDSTSDPNHEH